MSLSTANPMNNLTFSAKELQAYQQQNFHYSHLCNTTTDDLRRAQSMYAAKLDLYNLLWQAAADGSGEITIRTQTVEVKLLVTTDTLSEVIEKLAPSLETDLSRLESRILHKIAQLEEGDNGGELEISPEQWAARALLTQQFDETGLSKSPHDARETVVAQPLRPVGAPVTACTPVERCPLLPEAVGA